MILSNSLPEENGESTSGDWRGDAWEPPSEPAGESQGPGYTLPVLCCGALLRTFPERRPSLIEGLLRKGETMNIIAAPKIGKSWLSLGLAFAVATGRPWRSSWS